MNVNRAPAPAFSTGTSGAGSTSGAKAPIRTTAPNRSQGVSRVGVGVNRTQAGAPATGTSRAAGSSFAQRASGATVGTTSRGGQPVFASAGKGRKAAASKERGTASTPSTRSAAADLWSGFKPGARSSVFAAQASAQPKGMSGTVTAALAFLGLGLVGIAGASSFVALRSRRAKSRPTAGGSGSTQM